MKYIIIYRFDHVIRNTSILLVIYSLSFLTFAFDNEPKGFRGLDWGKSITEYNNSSNQSDGSKIYQGEFNPIRINPIIELSNTMQWRRASSDSANSLLKIDPQAFNLNRLNVYTRSGDKKNISRVNTDSTVYYFYKSRFIASSTLYAVYAQPGGKTSRHDVPDALEQQFGRPTETSSFLSELANKNLFAAYKGETTTIINECTNPKGAYNNLCVLLFLSTKDWTEYLTDSQAILKEWQNMQKNQIQEEEREKAEKKAKEDAKPNF